MKKKKAQSHTNLDGQRVCQANYFNQPIINEHVHERMRNGKT